MDWWDWRNPDFTLTFVGAVGGIIGAVVAVAIPIFLFLAARKGEAFAQKALDEQRRILARQRRDQLLATLPELTDRRTFRVLSAEVHDYSGDDHRLLLRAVRVNPLSPLPTVRVSTDEAEDFVESLPVRYARREGWEPFPELAPFLRACGPEVTSHLSARIINVLTGPAAVEQRPSHTYYRELVARGAWFLAPSLLYSL